MTDKPVSPLRQRMIEDMTVRHFKEKVQKDYIRLRAYTATDSAIELVIVTERQQTVGRSELNYSRRKEWTSAATRISLELNEIRKIKILEGAERTRRGLCYFRPCVLS
jgi:hypothetical protein